MPAQIDIFFSYAHEDEALRDQLAVHLCALRQSGMIREWHDRRLKPGDDWKHELDNQIEKAHVILLLVSVDFAASEYCVDVEMKRAIERHAAGTAHVIPIILRPCRWQNLPLAKLQVLPKDGVPIVSWSSRDEAWMSVVDGILTIVNEIQDKQGPHEAPSLPKPRLASADRKDGAAPAKTGGKLLLFGGRQALLRVGFYVVSIVVGILLWSRLPYAELLPRVGLGVTASVIVFETLRSSSKASWAIFPTGSKEIALRLGVAAALFVICLAWPVSSDPGLKSTPDALPKEPSIKAPAPAPPLPSVTIKLIGSDGGCPTIPPGARVALDIGEHPGATVQQSCEAVIAVQEINLAQAVKIELDAGDLRLEEPERRYPLSGPIEAQVDETTKVMIRFMVPRGLCPAPSTEPALVVNDRRIRLDFDENCVASVVLPLRFARSTNGTLSLSTRGLRLEAPNREYDLANGEIRATLEYLSMSGSWIKY